MILECGYRKVSGMTTETTSKNFIRYFRSEDLLTVEHVFEDIMETMGFMWGFASDPDYKPGECYQRPWLLPIKIYYYYARNDQKYHCDKPSWMAYVSYLPPDGVDPDPGTKFVKPYIVISPRMFDQNDPDVFTRPRTLTRQGDIRWPGTFATYNGEKSNLFPHGGL